MEYPPSNNFPPGKLDEQLQQLALIAQQYPPSSVLRQKTLNKLFGVIMDSEQLWYPQKDHSYECYKEVYQEAKQNLWLYICQNIEKYNPDSGSVMNWVNMLLCRRFYKEAKSKFTDNRFKNVSNWDNLSDSSLLTEDSSLLSEMFWAFVNSDPEDFLKQTYIENHPEANLQALLKLRLAGYVWKEISLKLKIKNPTLMSFFRRSKRKLVFKFKEYLD